MTTALCQGHAGFIVILTGPDSNSEISIVDAFDVNRGVSNGISDWRSNLGYLELVFCGMSRS